MTTPERQRSAPRRRRRIPLGPGQSTGWSPSVSASSHDADADFWLNREIDQLVAALEDKGELRRRDLGRLVGCKYWGPGRFRHALSAAVEQGRIRRTGWGKYAPAGS